MGPSNLIRRGRPTPEQQAKAAKPMTRLEERREELRARFTEMQWDLGGAAYEMAARDYFRLDVLAGMASRLQVVDAELAEIERMTRLEKAGAAGSCAGCGSLFARGALYCWRCGRNLNESSGTVVGPSAAGQIVIGPAATTAQESPTAQEIRETPLPPETSVPPEASLPPEASVPTETPVPPEPPNPPAPEQPEPEPEAVPEMRA